MRLTSHAALCLLACALLITSLGVHGTVNNSVDDPVVNVSKLGEAVPHQHKCAFDKLRRLQELENVTSRIYIRHQGQEGSGSTGAAFPFSSPSYSLRSTARVAERGAAQTRSVSVTSTLSSSAAAKYAIATRAGYAPIRISAFFADLDDDSRYCTRAGQSVSDHQGGSLTCTDLQVLTEAKRDLLVNTLVPQALLLHAERLMVERVSGAIVVPDMGFSRICNAFTIPTSHHSTGVTDADMIVYVAAGPITAGTVAWATSCSYADSGRPAIGVINVSPQYIADTVDMTRVLGHELLHAMGFSSGFFSSRNMVTVVNDVRGKSGVSVVSSPNVLARTRAQYGCDTAPGMELEDEGGSGTAGSHWKRRNAITEMMAGVTSIGYYSAITIALMEDLGYYKGIYEMAEPFDWGANAGCDFLEKKCVEDGVTQFPNMFCTVNEAASCSTDRRGIGYCGIISFSSPLDEEYRYFPDDRKGGSVSFMDYCPLYSTYTSSVCTEATGSRDYAPGAFFSTSSRCLDAQYVKVKDVMGTQKGLCVNIQCDAATSTYKVWFAGGRQWVPCPVGEWVDPSLHSTTFTFGAVQCASYSAVCGLTNQATDEKGFNNAASVPTTQNSVWLRLLIGAVLALAA